MGNFVMYIDHAGEFRWYLMAENGRKIADSGEGYRVRQDCEDAIKLVKRLAQKAKIESVATTRSDSKRAVETLIEH
jgi:uncharacterized protein YegP (UPF0339 family)